MVYDNLLAQLSSIYGGAELELVKLVCFVLTTYFVYLFVALPVKILKSFLQLEETKSKKKRW